MASGSNSETKKTELNWEVGPTEDVVHALLETLVDPRLPLTINEPPSTEAQNSVAKQMHAVVLLYNYYHRNQKPDLELLDFVSFCKLALTWKPSLSVLMNVANEVRSTALNVDENLLSVTEKAVMDACDIAMALDASEDVPVSEGWQISKVAVLVIDSKKENCLLQFGAVTEGVWSLFEKEISAGNRVGMKRRSCTDWSDDIMFLKFAVKGVDCSDLVLLESHVTYSLSKKKSAARFYMLQYGKQFDTNRVVPLEFLVESLRGPLAKKYDDGWACTDFVGCFQMLPYVGFISSWLSRGKPCLQSSTDHNARNSTKSGEKESTQSKIDASEPRKNLPFKGSYQNTAINENVMKNFNKRSEVALKNEWGFVKTEIFDNEDYGYLKGSSCATLKVAQNMVSNQKRESVLSPQCGVNFTSSVTEKEKKRTAESQSMVVVKQNPIQLVQFDAYHNNDIEMNNKHDSEVLQNVMSILCRKRQQLCSQVCSADDLLLLHEDIIERLKDGGDIVLARKCFKSFICGKDDYLSKNESKARTGLPDIYLPGRSSCDDLECICLKNNWRVPRYFGELSDGKFLSNVFVGSKSFELSLKGGFKNSPGEAREFAASQMIVKIRQHFFG